MTLIGKLNEWDFVPTNKFVKKMIVGCIKALKGFSGYDVENLLITLNENLARNVTNEYLETHNVDWDLVSRFRRFTNKELLLFENKINWLYIIGYYENAPVELLLKHAFDVEDSLLERALALGYENFGDELLEICPYNVWEELSGRDLSDNFIEKWGHRIVWDSLFNNESGTFIDNREDVSHYVEKYCRKDDLSDVTVALLLSKGKLSFEFIMKYMKVKVF